MGLTTDDVLSLREKRTAQATGDTISTQDVAELRQQYPRQAVPVVEPEAPEDPGFFKQIGNDIAGGVVDYAEMVGRGGRAIPGGEESGSLDRDGITGGIIDWAEKTRAENPNLAATGALHEGIRAATTSITASLPGLLVGGKAGAAIGSTFGPVGTVIGGLAGGVLGGAITKNPLFGAAEYDSFMEESVKAGKTPEESHSHALASAGAEIGGELLSDLTIGVILKGGGSGLSPIAKELANKGLAQMFKLGGKETAKRFGATWATETGSELATGGVQTAIASDHGLTDRTFWDGATQAFGPAGVASAIFAGFGVGMSGINLRNARKALENPKADPKHRMGVVNDVARELENTDKDIAARWKAYASEAVVRGEKISTTEDLTNLQGVATQAATTFALPAPDGGNLPSITAPRGPLSRAVNNLTPTVIDAEYIDTTPQLGGQGRPQIGYDPQPGTTEYGDTIIQPTGTDAIPVGMSPKQFEEQGRMLPPPSNVVTPDGSVITAPSITDMINTAIAKQNQGMTSKELGQAKSRLNRPGKVNAQDSINITTGMPEGVANELPVSERQMQQALPDVSMPEVNADRAGAIAQGQPSEVDRQSIDAISADDLAQITGKAETLEQSIPLAANYADSRLKRSDFRDRIAAFVQNNTSLGSVDAVGKVGGADDMGRNGFNIPSSNPKWAQEAVKVAGSTKVTINGEKRNLGPVENLRRLVRMAARGDKLTDKQAEAVRLVLNEMTKERLSQVQPRREELIARQNLNRRIRSELVEEGFFADAPQPGDADRFDADQYEAATYEDLSEVGRHIHDLATEAESIIGKDALIDLLESNQDDGIIAKELYRIIEGANGRASKEGGRTAEKADAAPEKETSRQEVTPATKKGEDGKLFSAPSTFGKKPQAEGGANVSTDDLAFIAQPLIDADNAKQIDMFAPEERRTDANRRKAISEMTTDEMRLELLTDPLTGIKNRRAFDEAPEAPHIASLDVDGLKWVNDTMGHPHGDMLLRMVGTALADQTDMAYHISGDEFIVTADTAAELQDIINRTRAQLTSAELTYTEPDGTVITKQGMEFGYGQGTTLAEAEGALKLAKSETRGREPQGVVRTPAAGRQVDGEAAAKEEGVAGKPAMNVGDTFEDDGITYEIDAISDGRVDASDIDSGAMESWSIGAFESVTGRKVAVQNNSPSIDSELADLNMDDLSAMFDEVAAEKMPAAVKAPSQPRAPRRQSAKPPAPKPAVLDKPKDTQTASRIAAEAAKHGVKGVDSAMKGLVDLFGGKDTLKSFPSGLDPETYAQAKPHFQQAFSEFRAAGKGVKDFFRFIIENFSAKVKPYLMHFLDEVKNGDIVELGKEGSKNDADKQNGRPAVSAVGGNRAPEDADGRSSDAQQDPAPADPGYLAGEQSENDEGPGPAETSGQAGVRPAGKDVADDGQPGGIGDAPDRREGAGGSRVANAGTGRDGRGGRVDFHIADPLAISGGGQAARFTKNQGAIETLAALTEEGRYPTAEEQAALAGYTGWGSFGQELFNGTWDSPAPKAGWEKRDSWLRDHLGKSEWQSAQRSILNAHYTDPPTVMAMWSMIERMGFTGGKVLEPAMGIGNFFGMMPAHLKERSQLAGIELDELTGSMAKALYPKSNISIKPYQDSKTPDGFYDLVVGNWPFDSSRPADRRYQKVNPVLHDYFFLKALDQVRPGGLVVGITSRGTMDKVDKSARRAMAQKGELVAAFRLPSGAFKEYAGTAVVTDIIILRKRTEPLGIVQEPWISSEDYDTPSGEKVRLSQYYIDNPQNVIGKIDYGHGTASARPGLIVHRPPNMQGQLERIIAMVPVDGFKSDPRTEHISYITNHTDDRQNSITETKDGLFVVRGEHLAPANEVLAYELKSAKDTAERVAQISHLITMRKDYAALIQAERTMDGADAHRATLRKNYESFVKKNGPLGKSYGLMYMKRIADPFYPSLAALEINGKPAKILSQSTTRTPREIKNPTTSDAFVLARNITVSPTLKEIAEIAGKSESAVRDELVAAGAAFETLDRDIIPTDIYLSGNVRTKLREAEAWVADGNDHLQRNIEALKKVIPKDVPYHAIEVQMGATWVPEEDYSRYVAHMLNRKDHNEIQARYIAGRWKINFPGAYNHLPEADAGFGTPYLSFKKLVNAAISNQSVTIRREDSDGVTYVHEEGTKEVAERIAKIRETFGQWVWSDAERRVALEQSYNESRNAYAKPVFDGNFLAFHGMSLALGNNPFNLRKHQVDAIWRGLVTRRSLNAHEVGTGKTFTMGGIAVESRRYGIAKKPLLLAHNANSATVAAEIQAMYPAAQILYIDNLSPASIDVKLQQIANDDWDLVVMPHSLIDRLALTKETLMAMAQEEIDSFEQEAREAAEEDGVELTQSMLNDPEELKRLRSPTAKDLVRVRNRIIESIEKSAQRAYKENAVSFEDLGIDMVLVDEAHEFKKPPLVTKMKMKGLNTGTSGKSIALRFLTRYIRANNGGGNVHLFTGTPITNTLTEVFHQMRYIMEDEMADVGIDSWDGWFGSFAAEVSDVELNAAAEYESVVRLASFINVPELRRMMGQYMDVVFSDDMPEMVPRKTASGKTAKDDLTERERLELENGRTENAVGRPYKKIIVDNADMTPQQKQEFQTLQGYAKAWRQMSGKDKKETMRRGGPESPIITEGLAAKASMDVRLIDGEHLAGKEGQTEDHENSKASRAVKNILEVYRSSKQATQAVFTEIGLGDKATRTTTSSDGNKSQRTFPVFSTIDDIVARLIKGGIPKEEIAVVRGSTSKQKRKEIAQAMNETKIRVVIGNSQTLGVGVNMQRNLRAMHHLDAPWMPGDLEQRNGRGHRQGNQWNTVLEYRYLTDRLDGRRWQILSIKGRFIKEFLKANESTRVIEGDAAGEEENDLLETFSSAAGDPRILLLEKAKKKVESLQGKERIHTHAMADAKRQIRKLNDDIDAGTREDQKLNGPGGVVEKITAALAGNKGEDFRATLNGKEFTERNKAAAALEKLIETKVRIGDRNIALGNIYGFQVAASFPNLAEEPYLVITVPLGANSFHSFESTRPSIAAVDGALRSELKRGDHIGGRIEEIRASLTRMEQVAEEPFTRDKDLQAAKELVDSLMADMEANPVPPPAWLRNGAPVDTEVFRNGDRFIVTGHRWTSEGWFVMAQDDKGQTIIPYEKAADEQGLLIYEAREFESPEAVVEKVEKDESEDTRFAAENTKGSYFTSGLNNDKITDTTASVADAKILTGVGLQRGTRLTPKEVTGANSDALREAAKTFGKRIVFYSETAGHRANGKRRNSTDGFVTAKEPGVLFLNVESNRHLLFLVGHETGHLLGLDTPEAYRKLLNDLLPHVDPERYAAYEKRLLSVDAYAEQGRAALYQEFVSDLIGEFFVSKGMFGRLAQEKPTLFKRIADAIKKVFDKITMTLNADKAAPVVNDIAQANRIIAEALKVYAKRSQSAASSDVGEVQFSVSSRPSVYAETFDQPTHNGIVNRAINAYNSAMGLKDDGERSAMWAGMKTSLLDRYHPIKQQLGEEAYRLHRMLNNSAATLGTFLQHGKLSWDGSGLTIKTRDAGFVPWLKSLGSDGHDFLYWVAAKRAEKLDAQDRENWLTEDKRREIIRHSTDNGKKTAQFEKWNEKLQEYNKNVIDIAMQAGLIDPESRQRWMSDYYLPFYRVLEDEATAEEFLRAPSKSKRFISARIKQLKGGESMLGDPMENIIHNWSHLITESQRNMARSKAANVAVGYGLAQKVKASALAKIIGGQTEYQVKDETGELLETFTRKRDAEQFALTSGGTVNEKTLLRFGTKEDHHIISYQENGQPVYLEVSDPALFEALSQVNTEIFDNVLMKFFGGAKRLLTAGATFTAAFRISNALRDTLHTAIVSQSFSPFIDTAKGIVQVWRKSDDYIALMASGGGFSQGYLDSGDPKALKRSVDKIIAREGKGARGRILDSPRAVLDFWERIGHASEMAARTQLYTNLKAKGETHVDAAFRARDLLDFALSGQAGAVRMAISATPFLNARMQGLDRLVRGAKEDPKAFAIKGALLTAASLALWAASADDDRYKELEDWEKWQYHHFWIGEQHFRIPKAFEVGAIFSTLFESGADVAVGNEDFSYFTDMVGHTMTQTFAIGMPTIVGPTIEAYANKSAFTGRNIESIWDKDTPAGLRSKPWTPEILKDIGEATNISPLKMQHMLRGHLASFAGMFFTVTDALYNLDSERPEQSIAEITGMRRFIPEGPASTKYATRFYDFADEVAKMANEIKYYRQHGDMDKARALAEENRDSLKFKRYTNQVRLRLSRIRQREKKVWQDDTLDSRAKRAKLDELKLKKNEIYQRAYARIYEEK